MELNKVYLPVVMKMDLSTLYPSMMMTYYKELSKYIIKTVNPSLDLCINKTNKKDFN